MEFADVIDKVAPAKLEATPLTSWRIISPPAKSHGCSLGVIYAASLPVAT